MRHLRHRESAACTFRSASLTTLLLGHVKIAAASVEAMDTIRTLLREYQAALGVDLCFQGFDAELDDLPGSYAPPRGRLLLAHADGVVAGCVALRPLSARRCEMKRLYVRGEFRGAGIGRALVSAILSEARAVGYAEMVLDTLPTMIEAQRLYEMFGFHDVAPYCDNPIPGTRYLGRALSPL